MLWDMEKGYLSAGYCQHFIIGPHRVLGIVADELLKAAMAAALPSYEVFPPFTRGTFILLFDDEVATPVLPPAQRTRICGLALVLNTDR